MTDFEKVLMQRDGMTREEAEKARRDAREEIMEMIEDGASYDEVADMLAGDYMLEMDYISDIL